MATELFIVFFFFFVLVDAGVGGEVGSARHEITKGKGFFVGRCFVLIFKHRQASILYFTV